tara:strand:- start:65 stop:784 length:720 start_codon:yes stop_codon:yes gene_type:complete
MTSEYRKFSTIADQWWDENGKFAVLHKINPLRIKYIIKQITKIKKINIKNKQGYNKINIVDIGCGGGLVCEPLARIGAKVSGLDFVKKNIKIAKKHSINEGLNIKYIVSNIDKINLKSKYDVILLLEVIEHLDNWQKILSKLKTFLRPNGILIISTINRNFISFMGAIFIAEKIFKWIPSGTHNYNKFIKPEELKKELLMNKFKVIDISGLIFNPIKRSWSITKKNTKINYFCTVQKIN